MSYRIPATAASPPSEIGSASSATSEEIDDGCSDWASDLGEALRTRSLFDSSEHATPEEAIKHDTAQHGVDVTQIKHKLALDVYGLMRLVNLVRKEGLSGKDVLGLEKDDERLKDDALLVPVIPDDPLLQLGFDDWSDDEDVVPVPQVQSTRPTASDAEKIKQLEEQLGKAKKDLDSLRTILRDSIQESEQQAVASGSTATEQSVVLSVSKGKGKIPAGRDDDTHYFDSYAENDIHEIMLKDTTRTVSYGKFIMSNPAVFKDAIVLDVGCGTGILSMLAAKAGAKHVYAIEASALASKTRENIKNNGLESVITVIQGKVENIDLPVKEVDVIISEWMGYMLLYESMLDSVLDARDRFLKPGGLMAPSQTRLAISAITGQEVWKTRVDFWKSVYGFDMTAMDSVYFDEGLVEVVDASEVITNEAVVRDINCHDATPKSLDFHSSFQLTAKRDETIRAFLTHFDTFFSPNAGAKASHVPPTGNVDLTKYKGDEFSSAVEPAAAAGAGTPVSFTTGPRGTETHWRQVVFLLRTPVDIKAGEVIRGQFYCRKSATNSRELDVEVHFAVSGRDEQEVSVNMYKVR